MVYRYLPYELNEGDNELSASVNMINPTTINNMADTSSTE